MKLKFCSRDYDGSIDWTGTVLLYLLALLVMVAVFAAVMMVRAQIAQDEFVNNVPPGYHVEWVPHHGFMTVPAGKSFVMVPRTYWNPVYVKDAAAQESVDELKKRVEELSNGK